MKTDNKKLRKALDKLPGLHTTDGRRGDLPAVYVFTPDSAATWIVWEYSNDMQLAYGLCDLGMGFPEIGYVSIPELEEFRGNFGMPVEVDSTISTRFEGYERARLAVPDYLKEKV